MQAVSTPITGSEQKIECVCSRQAALVDFYWAFNNGNLESMRMNWLQSAEASMDNPLGGIKRGWEEIEAVYDRIFNGDAKVYVEFYDYTVSETAEMFCAVGREKGSVEVGGEKLELAIRTSRIYQKVDDSWKQIHHHGSITDPEMLKRYQALVMGK